MKSIKYAPRTASESGGLMGLHSSGRDCSALHVTRGVARGAYSGDAGGVPAISSCQVGAELHK